MAAGYAYRDQQHDQGYGYGVGHEGAYPPTRATTGTSPGRGGGGGYGLELRLGAAAAPSPSRGAGGSSAPSIGRTSDSWMSEGETTHSHTGLLPFKQHQQTPQRSNGDGDGDDSDDHQPHYGSYETHANPNMYPVGPPLQSPEYLDAQKESFTYARQGYPAQGTIPSVSPVLDKHDRSGSGSRGGHAKESSNKYDYAANTAPAGVTSLLKGYATAHQLAYILVVLLQTGASSALIAITWGKIQAGTPESFSQLDTNSEESLRRRSITVYLALLLFGAAFEIIAALDALRLNNTVQLIGVSIFAVAMMIYSALLDGQVENALTIADGYSTSLYPDIRPFIIAIPIIHAVAAVILAFLTWKLFQDFGWEVLHLLGADRKLKRRYTYYLVHLCLLKFDFFFFVGFSMQYLILVLSVQEAEFVITIIAFPVTVILLLLSVLAVRREIRWLSWIIFVACACALAYFVFKLYRLFDPSQAFRYQTSQKTLAVFSALAIIMLLLTFAVSIVCYRNYGNGLKTSIPPYWGHHKTGVRPTPGRKNSLGANGMLDAQSRMSID